MIKCDEVIDSHERETKTIPTNFNEKKAIRRTQNFYILLALLSAIIALLIAVTTYCFFIKLLTKNKALKLAFHEANKELKEVYIDNINQK